MYFNFNDNLFQDVSLVAINAIESVHYIYHHEETILKIKS